MIKSARILPSLTCVSILIATPHVALAEGDKLSGNYLFEVLQRSKPHEETLSGLLRGKRGLPTWVRGMASKGNYVASASEQVTVDGVAMELFSVCQPHNCSDSQVKLLYSADGKTAYVRVIDAKLGEHIFGDPSQAQKAPLMRQGL
ncbi:Ivy family c-type lysozyme inhibitor [Rhizobium sp. RU36D]|uniref:Ivy family c-type lysozyme inhibitor n=1 Tax=Rhizobium sp. RU36D TaxID=1907415 RepID=UPI0009D89228|nr:Ivy family c-type lysozyme inhibitor [Rhizobium sp. RU36D]SMD19559.1 Inhibitor of vertebrate lysozyme (Ivy) [Rhizobium sp. RU36D]